MHRKVLVLLMLTGICTVSWSASAQTALFDFGRTDLQSDANTWNNLTINTTVLNSLIDDTGAPFAGSLEVTLPLFDNGEPSQLGTENPMGDAAGFPVTATDDYFFGHTGPFAGHESTPAGQFRLFDLNPNLTYDFTFFASRTGVNDTRDTLYVLTGQNSDNGVLNASNNDSNVLQILDITPNGNNEIFIDLTAGPNNDNGSGFFYIGLMQVDAVPTPGALALLGIGFFAMRARRRQS